MGPDSELSRHARPQSGACSVRSAATVAMSQIRRRLTDPTKLRSPLPSPSACLAHPLIHRNRSLCFVHRRRPAAQGPACTEGGNRNESPAESSGLAEAGADGGNLTHGRRAPGHRPCAREPSRRNEGIGEARRGRARPPTRVTPVATRIPRSPCWRRRRSASCTRSCRPRRA